MKKIRVQKIIAHKKWEYVEVIEGSSAHEEIKLWNKAMNFCINQDRKELDYEINRNANEVSSDELFEESNFELIDYETLSPEEYAIQNAIKDIIWDEVQNLPQGLREIIILHFYKGKSLRAIAKEQNKNLFTIQKSFKSAKEKLKIALLNRGIF